MTVSEFAPCRLYLGTEAGLRVATLDGTDLTVTTAGLSGASVRAIDVHPSDPADAYVGCGLRGWGLHHTSDAGETFDALVFEDRWVWGIARHPTDPETVFVGTEPPMVFVSTDDGSSFEPCEGIEDLPNRSSWTFFHDPFRAGHVHGFAIHPDRPERVFAGVEHGALIHTPDGGTTWHEALAGEDLHRVAIDPADPDRILAAAGSGLHVSPNGGRSWGRIDDLRGKYLHAVVFDPADPAIVYVYADEDESPVYRSDDGGETWSPAGEGLPAARPADTLRLHPDDPAVLVYVGDVDEGSRVFVSTDRAEKWEPIGLEIPKVWRLEVAPVAGVETARE